MRTREVVVTLACLAASGCFDLGDMWKADPPKPFYTREPVEHRGPVLVGPAAFIGPVAFSADGAEVLYLDRRATEGGSAPSVLHEVQVADGAQRTVDTHGADVETFAPSPDGAALYAILSDGGVPARRRLYEAVAGTEVALEVDPGGVLPAASGGRLLVLSVPDGTERGQRWSVVDVGVGTVRTTPCGETVTFSPGGDEVACEPMQGMGIVRQRVSDGAITQLPGLGHGWASGLRWSEEGLVAAYFDHPDLLLGDPATGVVSARSSVGPHAAVDPWVSFSGDGRVALYRENECLAVLEESRTCNLSEDRLMMADLATGERTTLASSGTALTAFALSQDGAMAAYVYCGAYPDCTLHVRETGR